MSRMQKFINPERLRERHIVTVDMDGVLADFEGEFCNLFGGDLRYEPNLEKRYPNEADKISIFCSDPATYFALKPIKLGVAIVKWLKSQGFAIVIVSSRPRGTFQITKRWLEKFGVPYDELSVRPGSKRDRLEYIDPICHIDDLDKVANESESVYVPCMIMRHPWNGRESGEVFGTMAEFWEKFDKILHERVKR